MGKARRRVGDEALGALLIADRFLEASGSGLVDAGPRLSQRFGSGLESGGGLVGRMLGYR
ncbi:MAG TPA: hypothetical protein DD435_13505 [Cyanobacteria bacterium UBA8530]|nr:hypothetical protein [Cyanobacteria bacterium UBA8530]